ncbi:hypothetical protein EC970264_2563 [Escherichia coli 97.0264]|nr:hypothetical protein EC970264_2563 [Escherichia coli 97.0264]
MTEAGGNILIRSCPYYDSGTGGYSVHLCRGLAERRSQSTPAVSQANCSAVSDQVVSPSRGQRKAPWCRRRVQSQTPWRSHIRSFMRVRFFPVKRKASPSRGGCPAA